MTGASCLSDERKWYLYEHIRPFCSDNRKVLFVHVQLYQIQDMAAHLYLRIKQTHSSLVMMLTEPNATLLH